MSNNCYLRYPAISNNKIAFICEDSLWVCDRSGDNVKRITGGTHKCMHPVFSPNGDKIAFVSDLGGGEDVYVIDLLTSKITRLTRMAAPAKTSSWSPDGKLIYFSSGAKSGLRRCSNIFSVNASGEELPKKLLLGPARDIIFSGSGTTLLNLFNADPAYWKRYKGGTCGKMLIDANGSGKFKKLININGNTGSACIIGKRVYFVSDYEGKGDIYSCTFEGKNLKRHTNLKPFYPRNLRSHKNTIVFHGGGDLYYFDALTDKTTKINISVTSDRPELDKRYVDPCEYLENFKSSASGKLVALNSRGRVFVCNPYAGPVFNAGYKRFARHAMPVFLNDGGRILLVSDESGEERLEIHPLDYGKKVKKLTADIGTPLEIKISPTKDLAALTNIRNQFLLVNLKTDKVTVIANFKSQNQVERFGGFNWSPDGNYIAYGFPDSNGLTSIKLYDLKTNKSVQITNPVIKDTEPSFDPEGKYLFYSSYCSFTPQWGTLYFDLSFTKGQLPCFLTLQKNTPNPLYEHFDDSKEDKKPPKKIKIDLDGIAGRSIALPVPEGVIENVTALKGGKVMYTKRRDSFAPMNLYVFKFKGKKEDIIAEDIESYSLSLNEEYLYVHKDSEISVLKQGDKLTSDGHKAHKLDMERLTLEVNPKDEWRQILAQVWRLQRENFYYDALGGKEWLDIYKRYSGLVNKAATRGDLSDIIWEMQGELGTSHAYEYGGDYPARCGYNQGFLGADYEFDAKNQGYKIKKILSKNFKDAKYISPLMKPGVNIKEGDIITAVDGKKVSKTVNVESLLVNKANIDVVIEIKRGKTRKECAVRPLGGEAMLYYTKMVEENRALVYKQTSNKCGYIHIPDMMFWGYVEFFKMFGREVQKDALIIDVRGNAGGFVSQLLLKFLTQKRLGYQLGRHDAPEAYPNLSPNGPIVLICDEHAGSDGDIFPYAFKALGLGKIVGKRTWGGVVGIYPKISLIDCATATQPESATWFKDIGFGLENRGVDPDFEVDNLPQDYAKGTDRQLNFAIDYIIKQLKTYPALKAPKKGTEPKPNLECFFKK